MLIDSFRKHINLTLLFIAHSIYPEQPISGLIGGLDPSSGYAATVSPLGLVKPIPVESTSSEISGVALNNSGLGLLGGGGMGRSYAAFVSSNNLTPITDILTYSHILSVAINESGTGLLGGQILSPSPFAYATFVSPNASPSIPFIFPKLSPILSVAINNANLGLVGAFQSIAAFISPDAAAPLPIATVPRSTCPAST